MKPPPQPSDESRRLEALQQYDLLDTLPEQSFDDLTALAAQICGAPVSLISLVDEKRQWFKSKVGLSVNETPRDISFCGHAILQRNVFMVPDAAKDERFAKNPLVTGDPKIRFYASAPLITADGLALGTLCVLDRVPRQLSAAQQEALQILSRQVMAQLELRRQTRELIESEARLFKVFRNCPVGMTIHRWSDRKFVDLNAAFTKLVGWTRGEVIDHTTDEIGLIGPEGAARLRAHLKSQTTIRDVEVAVKTRSGQALDILIGTELIELRGDQHAITTFVDITDRKKAEAESQRHHKELQLILDTVPALVFYKDREGRFLRVNRALAQIMGVPAEDFVGKTDFEMGSPEGDRYRKDDLSVMSSGQPIRHREERLFTPDGIRWLLTDKLPYRDEHGRVTGVVGFSVDITERKQAELRIQHLIRVYAVLSDINQTIVREKDPQIMLESACRIAVEKGQLCMAWIGLVDAQTGRLRIAAHAGASEDTLEFLNATLGNQERTADCVFTMQALQTGEHGVCNDIANDAQAASWRNAALKRGYYAMASLPLKVGDKTIGTFNLYAGETGFFDEEELRLLDELAMDIGFGVEIGQREAERRAAEDRNARQRSALIALTGHRDLDGRDVPAALRLITESAAHTLGVARVSIWRYNRNHTSIECVDLFELEAGRHSSGSILSATTHPGYFRALAEVDVIAANDANRDPRTREFADDYLRPLGIQSMLDVPVQVGGVLEGVLCHEHIGSPRAWTTDEKTFAVAMANLVSLALEGGERREAERAVAEKTEVLEAIFNNAPVMLCFIDAHGRLRMANREFERVFGWTLSEMRDHPSIFKEWYPDAEYRACVMEFIRTGASRFAEFQTRVRNGNVITTSFASVTLSGGTRLCIGLDVTGRKAAEEELKRREVEFRSLIENASDLITVVNGQGIIRFQSPSAERVLGYKPESMIGQNALELIHPEDVGYTAATLRMALADSSAPVSVEYRFRHKDGSWRFLQSVGRNIPSQAADGFIVINSRDITERRMLEEQFRQSQKMEAIGQLAGGVAHDFNNILTVIQGYGSLLQMSEDKSASTTEAVQEILDASERAANLTRQLLAFSRRQVMQPKQLDLNEVIITLTKMLQRILGEDVRLQLNLYPRPLMTRADAGMLDQVLMNLVINARDAMPKGGQLFITTTEKNITAEEARATTDTMPGHYVCISVADTGSGIPPENLSRIFEPFFTTKEPGKGTGLGLATVFGIIKQHGGSLTVESEVGRGTTFHIYLPISQAAMETKVEEVKISQPRGGNETILLAEDEPSVRGLKRVVLERHGYKVLEAAHGVEALKIWEQHEGKIQLLFTDIVMPEGINGRDLAARLLERDPKLRVIFTSGYSADIAGRELSLREGQNFLQKPCPPHVLLETVRRCLDA